jgi:hypothetical protein
MKKLKIILQKLKKKKFSSNCIDNIKKYKNIF